MRKKISYLIIITLILATIPANITAYDKTNAIDYLKNNPIDDWSVMALASSKSLSGVNTNFLNSDPGNKATDIEKRVLARDAAGMDDGGLADLLASQFDGTEIGEGQGLLNDDIFGLLALSAINKKPRIRGLLAEFIKQNQNSDGGWGFAHSPGTSDSNDTAMAIMALVANGENKNSNTINKAFSYIETTKKGGGYGFNSAFSPDTGSTAWAVSAYRAVGKTPNSEAINFLNERQQSNGSFAWQNNSNASSLMTAYAVIALNTDFYPIQGRGGGDPEPEPNGKLAIHSSVRNLTTGTSFAQSTDAKINHTLRFRITTSIQNNTLSHVHISNNKLPKQLQFIPGSASFSSTDSNVELENPTQQNLFSSWGWKMANKTGPRHHIEPATFTVKFDVRVKSPGTYINSAQSSSDNAKTVKTENTIYASEIENNDPNFQVAVIDKNQSTLYADEQSFDSFTIKDKNGKKHNYNSPNALGTLLGTRLDYQIADTSFGLFVESIANQKSAGTQGWMYSVNGTKPSNGAGDFILKNNDQVIWFYNNFNAPSPNFPDESGPVHKTVKVKLQANIAKKSMPKPNIQLQADKANIKIGDEVTLTWRVKNADNINSSPNNWTGNKMSGSMIIQPNKTTEFTISASNSQKSSSNSITINVNQKPSIVFGVSRNSIDFGTLNPGENSEIQDLQIFNNGVENLQITTILKNRNDLYHRGLELSQKSYQNFKLTVNSNKSKKVSLQLKVPQNINSTGKQTDTLVFEARTK